jgi:hypothetical protein
MCATAIRRAWGWRFFFFLFKKNNIFSPLSLPFLKRERDITHRTTAKLSADPPTHLATRFLHIRGFEAVAKVKQLPV